MSITDLLIIAVSLSMDAFAVSICKGLSVPKMKLRHALICGVYFGGFQILMPLLGYLLGSTFAGLIQHISHWVAFVLLALIGANMVRESFGGEEEGECQPDFGWRAMLPLAVATAIDALAVGVSFAALRVAILPSVLIIGATTFTLSAAGVKIGNAFGARYQKFAGRIGGIVLILMGCKILLEGLGILG
ncbi:MAG: manganese efflux pump MntP family protein [Eubacteriales bacterium]|nr:manganese efflux pump MntP family protein [Eubacteriales bacterium]